ncbi:penicillin-binding protein activator [Oxalobacteraceae bacterium R-40]|uniref:Penicillin-binding protein activator n=1 Tax=Keguizhuia sedimenti TaxID=3064264 RepID=A0ABU1BJM2_9BURK|nr:penicillin-binding protein activator [Oxalobacteraceae bacterium R-40]
MLGEVRIVYRLAAMLGGLCLFISACATPVSLHGTKPGAGVAPTQAQVPEVMGPLAQNDLSISAETAGAQTFPVPAPILSPVIARIALLLPMQSETLGAAAAAVRAGFLAAAGQESSDAIRAETVESGDALPDVLASYGNASFEFDIVVGPLSRSGVSAIAQSGAVSKPTIALTQIDTQDETKTVLPKKMLIIGLSIEDQARQMAGLMHARKPTGTAIILTTPTSWQRRAAKAFAERWLELGYESELMELDISAQGTYLGANGLIQLQKRIQTEKPPFLFSALDAVQTRQLRMLIGQDIPVYGTSQLNPLTMTQWSSADPQPEMNGVRLVDMPWQLQADHPAVMAYPKPALPGETLPSADLERLYALGIDAFRVAKEVALGQSQFQIDGVTGKLRINLAKETGRFERIEMPAVYRGGRVVAVGAAK